VSQQRQTKQNRAVLAELRVSCGHLTADELYRRLRLRLPNISLGTVYRNLEKLVVAGHILQVDVPGGQRRFDGTAQPHPHVRCRLCGRVEDVAVGSGVQFPGISAVRRGAVTEYAVEGYRVDLYGLCPACASGAEPRSGE